MRFGMADDATMTGSRGKDRKQHPTLGDRLALSLSLAALIFLVFVAGALTTAADLFPGSLIADAYKGGEALHTKLTKEQDVFKTDLWYRERRKDRGVTVNDPAQTYRGVTLYTAANEPAVRLIDMKGNVLHEWRRPFSTVPMKPIGVSRPRPDPFVHIRQARLLPNGDLLAIYEGHGDTPYGYGVVKLDRHSNIVWTYPGRAHHQLDIGPDGRIYVLTHRNVQDRSGRYGHLKSPRLDDFLVVLSPEGKELKRIELIEVVRRSRFSQLLYMVSGMFLDDPLHANAVDYIDRREAAQFGFGKEGQVLLSFRELGGSIAVLDVEKEEMVWATTGPWIGQHDPDILPNGNILLFDNLGHHGRPEGASRVIEFKPETMEIVWQYTGTRRDPLYSFIRSEQQRLPNGNTLITESDGGRILEVTPRGQVVWQFVNPVRGGPKGDKIPMTAWAERLDPSTLDPALLAPDGQTAAHSARMR